MLFEVCTHDFHQVLEHVFVNRHVISIFKEKQRLDGLFHTQVILWREVVQVLIPPRRVFLNRWTDFVHPFDHVVEGCKHPARLRVIRWPVNNEHLTVSGKQNHRPSGKAAAKLFKGDGGD